MRKIDWSPRPEGPSMEGENGILYDSGFFYCKLCGSWSVLEEDDTMSAPCPVCGGEDTEN